MTHPEQKLDEADLGNYRMPFGPYEGQPIGDVSPEHLARQWKQAQEYVLKVYAFFMIQGYGGLENEDAVWRRV
jgi:hypothetical protein